MRAGPYTSPPACRRGRIPSVRGIRIIRYTSSIASTNTYKYSYNTTQHPAFDEFNPSTQKHLATLPRPSSLTPHAQTPIFPRNHYIYRGQHVEHRFHRHYRTQEPQALSSPTERNLRCDQKPFGGPPILLGLSECVNDSSTWDRGKMILVQRPNGGSR